MSIHITAKLGNMRKAVEWIVYPRSRTVNGEATERILIQSDHRIAEFDPATGRGVLSKHCATHAGFMMLALYLGATAIVVPAEVIAAAVAAQPKPGDEVAPGLFV